MYCINPESDEPIFCLWELIGVDEKNPTKPFVDGNQFARELLYMDGEGKKRIQIWINSEGGSIKDGWSIISAMLNMKTKVDTLVIGIAYSMGGVIAIMGRRREMMDYSSLMLHLGWNPDGEQDKGLDVINEGLIAAVVGRMGKTKEEAKALLTAETYYTATTTDSSDNACEHGLIDNVINCNDINKPRQVSDKKALKTFAHAYLNKSISPKENDMKKSDICKLLKLDENTTDEVAFKALEDHIARGEKAIAALAKKKAEEDEEENDEDKKKSKAKADDEMAAKVKALEDGAAAKAESDKAQAKANFQAKAKIEITAKAKERNITKTEDIDNYVALAGESDDTLAKVIKTIDAIPVITKAAKLNPLNKDTVESIGIKEIPAGAEVDSKLSPIAMGAGDTRAVVDSINSFDYHRDWVNRKRK